MLTIAFGISPSFDLFFRARIGAASAWKVWCIPNRTLTFRLPTNYHKLPDTSCVFYLSSPSPTNPWPFAAKQQHHLPLPSTFTMNIVQQQFDMALGAMHGAQQAIHGAQQAIEDSSAFQSTKHLAENAFDAGKDYTKQVRLIPQQRPIQS